MKYGVGPDGNALSEKPEEIEQAIDWCKPGGPRSRENCIKLLVEHRASVHEVDYQGFTVLHFAAMWGEWRNHRVRRALPCFICVFPVLCGRMLFPTQCLLEAHC
jgi:hypothetical protein